MCKRFYLLLLFSFCFTLIIKAQQKLNYFFRHITQEDGLLHNQVYAITQDEKGFMWIATANGLQRYDGSRFVYYNDILSNPADKYAQAADMYFDKKNNLLWIIKNNTAEKMELNSKKLTLYTSEKFLDYPSLPFDYYTSQNNDKWFLNDRAVYSYDSATKSYQLSRVNISPRFANQSTFLATESNGNTWVSTGTFLYLFDKKNKRIYSADYNPYHHPLLDINLPESKKTDTRFIMVDSKQNIWITTWGNFFYKYDAATKKVRSYSLSEIKTKEQNKKSSAAGLLINSMLEDNHHNIWIGTENAGLLKYNNEEDNFDYSVIDEKSNGTIQYNYKIFSIFQDKEENLWIGTDRGINIFNPYHQYFKTIRHEEATANTLSKNEIISCIQVTNGDIYVGTWGGGIGVYDSAFHFKKNISFKGVHENNYVWSFLQVDEENLWIGCQHGYLLIYNTVTGAVKNSQPSAMLNSTIRCMQKDAGGNVWFGLHNGLLAKWDATLKTFVPASGSPTNAAVMDMFIDSPQVIWVSTEMGFKKFDPLKMAYTNTWLPDKNNTNSFSAMTSMGIEKYNDSTLIIGSVYGGLNFFNKAKETFSHSISPSVLPSANAYAIKKDTGGDTWITSDYGLYKFDPAFKKIVPCAIEPGIINSPFESNKFYQLQNGNWLTFTTTEVISFSPGHFSNATAKQSGIEITGFKLFGKPFQIDSLLNSGAPLQLTYKQNFFTIEFAELNYSPTYQANYYYKLDGVDKNWVNGGARRFASYTDLQPGKYIFFVKTAEGEGFSPTTSFNIIIEPPFWKTWWFIVIVAAFVFSIAYWFIKWRIKNVKAIEAEKFKVHQLQSEHYKSELELEQITNYFSSSLIDKNTVSDVLWDVAKNLIGRLGFVDCMMYLWNDDKTKMIQTAGFGPKGSVEEINKQKFDVLPGQGVVGYVMQTKESVLIPDTSKDSRYRADEMTRLSELAVPIIYNNDLIGVIDSEHHSKNFFTRRHLQILNTIATLIADKIKSIEAEQSLIRSKIEIYSINEQLSKARLEALRSQMNPHFIFNCINSIDALIQSNDKYNATVYLNKFAKLIRGILDSSRQDTVSLSNDIATLKLYIELEQFRHEDKFIAEVQADDELLQDDYKVPPLIIQPFVENAILHGLRYRHDNKGRLFISVNRHGDYLRYVIEDNGIGRNTHNNHLQKNKISYGISMSNERVKLFNNEEKTSVQITDLFSNGKPSGTKVSVLLKVD